MNSVSRVKAICKERKIPIYKLEKDLGFANGYIGQLKKGTFPDERLALIAEYLNVSIEYLATGEERIVPNEDDELREYLEELRQRPEMRMLFSVSKGATKSDIEKTVKIIEALKEQSEQGGFNERYYCPD